MHSLSKMQSIILLYYHFYPWASKIIYEKGENMKNVGKDFLKNPEYSHFKLALYWIAYAIMFFGFEFLKNRDFNIIACSLDYKIPFCEYFLIPYVFWYIFLFGTAIYTLFFDPYSFRKLMYFVMISYTIAFLCYLIYPSLQPLRPDEFERDNIFTDGVKFLYTIDTNTNVCPSIHVIGSLGACFTLWNTKPFSNWILRILNIVTTILICLSTVFLKQHSVIDMITGLLISIAIYPVSLMILKKQFVRG